MPAPGVGRDRFRPDAETSRPAKQFLDEAELDNLSVVPARPGIRGLENVLPEKTRVTSADAGRRKAR